MRIREQQKQEKEYAEHAAKIDERKRLYAEELKKREVVAAAKLAAEEAAKKNPAKKNSFFFADCCLDKNAPSPAQADRLVTPMPVG